MIASGEWSKHLAAKRLWTLPTITSILLIFLSQSNLLAFHTLAELATIIISYVVFALGWSTYELSKNRFLIFFACGYFWIGSLDLMHAFVFPGINIFVDGNANLSVQFWIASRYFEASLFLIASIALFRSRNPYVIFTMLGGTSIFLIGLILMEMFPAVIISGQGLTNFKIYSEYLIVAMLAISIPGIYRQREKIETEELSLIVAAVILTMIAEISFTLYDSLNASFFGIAGHIVKIYSFWFIFQAIIITNLRKPYAKIKLTEERLTFHIENTPLGSISWNRDFHITEWNKSAEKIFGYSADEAIGRHASGTILPAEIKDEINEIFKLLLDNKGGVQSTNENLTKDGETIVCDWYNTSIVDESGEVVGVTSLVHDLTERMQLEDQLRHSQRMEAVGQLTGGVAHDFNNLLAVMLGNAELLEDMAGEDKDAKKNIEAIKAAVDRASSLTGRLLAFSRQSVLTPVSADVCELIGGLNDMLQRALGETVELRVEETEDLWPAVIDTHQFENALVNLALNARDAMPQGGILTIETANVSLDETYVEQYEEVTPGDYVKVAVSDTGTGMPSDVLEKVFEPFFTTKEVGEGTGLGLSMVFGFVKQSNGHITIYSEVDHGTSVKLYIPRSQDEPVETDVKVDVLEHAQGSERILVVEDDADVRIVSVAILCDQGYEVVEAGSGEEAIGQLKAGLPFDLLFTDVVLPGGMNGAEIAKEARRIQPGIKVLYTTGYAENAVIHHGKLVRGVNMVNKPYRRTELLEKVREVLSEKAIGNLSPPS